MTKFNTKKELEKAEKKAQILREKFKTETAFKELQKLLVKMKLTKDEIELVKGLLSDLRNDKKNTKNQ